ncbi:hypothetical protein FHS27_004185 [Rhodopirellula rubra]|uniref:Uncharacterized protein n=1 Tax=Aporhodopirellula rubra TaxID=980271 RepID=A0A7W5H6B3_9BACT|nr:hypothetical protein [Aporhodopirellula rubra]
MNRMLCYLFGTAGTIDPERSIGPQNAIKLIRIRVEKTPHLCLNEHHLCGNATALSRHFDVVVLVAPFGGSRKCSRGSFNHGSTVRFRKIESGETQGWISQCEVPWLNLCDRLLPGIADPPFDADPSRAADQRCQKSTCQGIIKDGEVGRWWAGRQVIW